MSTRIVLARRFTVSATRGAEGRIFLSTACHGNVLQAITPWMGGRAVVRGWARHMATG